ncbi:MAG: DUF5683 domain-containing protein [Paludibacter sp.]|nr:DUF5683 domain-containing protein [Paludibacter sp.]
MKKILKKNYTILLLLTLLSLAVNAQTVVGDSLSILPVDTVVQQADSAITPAEAKRQKMLKKKGLTADSIPQQSIAEKYDSVKVLNFKPDPATVVWMGAIIPGMGQILNRSYWKLPLVYSSFLGCAYAITYTSTKYEMYKSAYRDITDTDPNTNSFLDILKKNGINSIHDYNGGEDALKPVLKNQYEVSRRYREISVYASIAVYFIVLIEAYVDAQMFSFDISTDLSLQIAPALKANNFGKIDMAGIGVSIRLK